MDPVNPSTSPEFPQPDEKQLWTPPVLQKMDIEETAFNGNLLDDGDGLS